MAYSRGKIKIPEVTGNIVINITTDAPLPPPAQNLFPSQFSDESGNPFNEGLGYQGGKKFSSSSQTVVDADANVCVTGFLSVNPGDKVIIGGASRNNTTTYVALTYYNSYHSLITDTPPPGKGVSIPPIYDYSTSADNESGWTIPDGVSYIRIGCDTDACAEGTRTLVVTKGEPLPAE